MKKMCFFVGVALSLVLLVYAILAYCVFCRYNPRIAREEARQGEWLAAIAGNEDLCRRIQARAQRNWDSRVKQKARLEKEVRDEASREALLRKNMKGYIGQSDVEWKRKAAERLARAQQVLADFEAESSKKDAEKDRGLMELRQQLATLRERQQELQDLRKKRDLLMVWPLPLIAPFVERNQKTNGK